MMIIRSLRNEDCERVAKIARSAIESVWPNFRSSQSVILATKRYDSGYFRQQSKEVEYWVGENEETGEVMGVIGLKDGEVRSFFVKAEYLNQGIGRELMRYLENKAIQRGLKELRVVSSEAAEYIYEKLGFRKIKVVPDIVGDEEFKEIYMTKFL